MRRTKDDVDTAADTERPPALGVWKCDGEGAEPPQTPEAQAYGGGALLAQSADDIAQWTFTAAGMRRLAIEMAEAVDMSDFSMWRAS